MSDYELPVPLDRFADQHPHLFTSPTAHRYLVRNRKANGLEASGAVVKRAGRWWIHPDRYLKWLRGDAA